MTFGLETMISPRLSVWMSLLSHACLVLGQSDTLGLSQGTFSSTSKNFNISLVTQTQTLFSLVPSQGGIDYIPGDMMANRSANLNYHVGDITFRVREAGTREWISGDSALDRKPVIPLDAGGNTFAAADLSPTLPEGSLLNVTRRWEITEKGNIQLLFDILNIHPGSM
jgi:hypothetical protein